MRTVEITQYGGPEALKIAEAPVPEPGHGEVLIQVAAAGLNRADILQREGHYPPPPGASSILGLEVPGHIARSGAGVNDWKSGDAVCALLAGGGYAEYCVAPAGQCLPVPENIPVPDAAALPEAVFTVWTNLFEPPCLNPGETLLVQGGASGVGSTAIQVARRSARGWPRLRAARQSATSVCRLAVNASSITKKRTGLTASAHGQADAAST